ncbi:XkdQ/YqbQ family protein [Chengkuizengella marina]|uniref:YqbQ/XkdQ domain-containing protein n=1 Tax=Chengkuizengella marina TaxID=2507566 RepID=A0A6N9Q7T6_9BACL|nr:hypothetical protein [Chengkuizengella marina]NBI30912.1 hypothetical protein [Chengkuizengella marina]
MFKLTLIKPTVQYDITTLVGGFSWDSEFTVTSTLEFDVVNGDTRFFPKNPCDVGDMVILSKGEEEIFRGILTEEEKKGRDAITYRANDFSWYLGQSKSVYQFNGISATDAITRILNDFGISIGSILTMPTVIDKIYILETPGKIIQDIIDKVGKHEGYAINGEMREGKLYLEKRNDLLIEGQFKLTEDSNYNVTDAIGDPQRKRSIEEMRNRIKLIVDDEETEYEITAEAEDNSLIERYGLIEETIKIDAEDAAKSRQVVKNLLRQLGRVHETVRIKLMGDIRFKSGRLFDVIEPVTGINNRFMIVSVKHQVSNQIHTMELELVLPEGVA